MSRMFYKTQESSGIFHQVPDLSCKFLIIPGRLHVSGILRGGTSHYAALVSLMNDLELIPNHLTHSFSFDNKQISSLSQTLHSLIAFIESYDPHGCTREAAEAMESRIGSAAHAAHDVIESHVVGQIHAGSTLLGGKATSYFLLDLQKAIDDMEFVKGKAMQFQVKCGLKAEQHSYSAPSTSSEPLTSDKNLTVEFDDGAFFPLLEMLTGEPSSKRVIPIVGMGGIGKTTLAQYAYKHSYIRERFDVLLWATISQEYSFEATLIELLFGARNSTTRGNVGELGEQLHKKLWGRRYLVVLDDMWSLEAWDEIQMFLPENKNGSRVIVTTRLSNLAARLTSFSPFEMHFLDEDKSWELFCAKVFGGKKDCPVEIEEIGKRIVKRCMGLPLSIVVIGGHLRRSSRAIEHWEKVSNSMNPISSLGVDEQCLNIISLSYEHPLPPYLKPCFLFMGIYRGNSLINTPELLEFWVAEGFLRPKEGQSLEEIAEGYLNDLIQRNLILVRKRRLNGKIDYCSIHDTVRELCLKLGKKDKFVCVLEDTTTQGIGCRERRIVIPSEAFGSDINGAMESTPLVRSLFLRAMWHLGKSPVELRLLRISANVVDVRLKKHERCFSAAHFQQVNLRYLGIHCHKSKTPNRLDERVYIPSSLSLLWNMQTFTIRNFDVPITAPHEIWDMPQLRHLEFYGGGVCLPDPPLPVPGDITSNQHGRIILQNLQTLEGVENLRLTEEVCKRMPNLKELYIHYNSSSGDCKEAASSYYCPHNLDRFNKLAVLVCYFSDDSEWHDIVLSFTFPTSLEDLCLWDSNICWEDLTTVAKSVPRLSSLFFSLVRGPEWDLVDEEFSQLKELMIFKCYDLVVWNADSSHFPVLEILHIMVAPNLREIPSDIGEIPTLKLIDLSGCNMSAALSAVRIVVEQESQGNDDLRLDIQFSEIDQLRRFKRIMREEGLIVSKNLRLLL